MLAHHTAGGCALQAGDLIGTGTISGPGPGEAGAMIELAHGGQKPVDIGGYYQPAMDKLSAAMRPSGTLNVALETLAG